MNTFEDMTTEELKELIRSRYQDAKNNGTLGNIATVARELGKDPAVIQEGPGWTSTYGPKYMWVEDFIEVYVDDYGHYMTVRVNGEQVCSTHPCSEFIIPGEWLDVVLSYLPKAQLKIQERNKAKDDGERTRLLAQLSASAWNLRAIPSEARTQASRENGKKGGRPKKIKD